MPSKTFHFTGGWQQWAVPKNVKWVRVTVNGAGSDGVHGGQVSGQINVNDKQTLWLMVGQQGKANSGNKGGGTTFGGGGAGGLGNGHPGGWSGGGASAIRINSRTGAIRCVAGGAGGTSGDGGVGGMGGDEVGESGYAAGAGTPSTATNYGPATGGTQIQGGNGGTSGLDHSYDGSNATDVALARGGAGGGAGLANAIGGGGGGGGYRAGGGGQGGIDTTNPTPSGGGGGGSNYTGGLVSWQSTQGTGNAGDGTITITWTSPAPANQPPIVPTQVKVAGKDAVDGQATNSTGQVTIQAKVDDPDSGQKVRLVVRYSPDKSFKRPKQIASGYVDQPNNKTGKDHRTGVTHVTLKGLTQNTLYYARLYSQDQHGLLSTNYRSINFWTNRSPLEPTLNSPADGASFSQLDTGVFKWKHNDPDGTPQGGFQWRWRTSASPTMPAGEWNNSPRYSTSFEEYDANPGTFTENRFHEWSVRTRDHQGAWGPWAQARTFFVTGTTSPPLPLGPKKNEAVDVTTDVTFSWRFRDPDQGDSQTKADLRYRPVGTPDWITLTGDTTTPGATQSWTVKNNLFVPGVNYEWQARTVDSLTTSTSSWSVSETFWAIATPGLAIQPSLVLPHTTDEGLSLGVGNNRAFVYQRGGQRLLGEITPLVNIQWGRTRDDMSNCLIHTNGFGPDKGALLASLHSWMHEIVVFRDGKRVWEGPITRIEDSETGFEIEAKDVMGWVYRRIIRQGYNDAYAVMNGIELGTYSVVQRAARIIMNALAPDDPNILPYLTSIEYPDDAGESRIVPDFGRTAWEEIDDMAATAGLDYVVVGRRIILNDTHRPIGRLPEMRNVHFSAPPVISEYGMLLATSFGVTDNNGHWGVVEQDPGSYGLIEQLASAYGESTDTNTTGATDVLTSEQVAALEKTLTAQAQRNISGRNPAPVIVRVPDNSTLMPDVPIDINQLVPGVWIPLRAKGVVRELAQWQKLDTVTVTQSGDTEQVAITLSPAPNGGLDPESIVGVETV